MSQPKDKLLEGLSECHLSSIPGSAFDNAFSIFSNSAAENNLVILGTNGNITDACKTTEEWLNDRWKDPTYCHVTLGDWGKSRLQKEIKKVPEELNKCFGPNTFSWKKTIVTNAILLASNGVGDIRNQFNNLRTQDSFKNITELIHASVRFFADYTLLYARPKVIFAYGNAEPGDSA